MGIVCGTILAAAMAVGAGEMDADALCQPSQTFPKVWMCAMWREPFGETVRWCAEQGVDVVETPTWSESQCARVLLAFRK